MMNYYCNKKSLFKTETQASDNNISSLNPAEICEIKLEPESKKDVYPELHTVDKVSVKTEFEDAPEYVYPANFTDCKTDIFLDPPSGFEIKKENLNIPFSVPSFKDKVLLEKFPDKIEFKKMGFPNIKDEVDIHYLAGPSELFQLSENNSSQDSVPEDPALFYCNKCPVKFKRKQALKVHEKIHHSEHEVKTFDCVHCAFKSKYKSHLNRHIRQIHKKEEQTFYKCNLCEYRTVVKNSLVKHELVHKSEYEVTWFQCNYCLYKSKYTKSLLDHIASVHKKEEQPLYKCNICPYQTVRRRDLKKHEIVHKSEHEVTMFQCSQCTFKTKYKKNFMHHVANVHSKKEKCMHKCSSCDYTTKRKDSFKKHELSHKAVETKD